MKTCRKGHEYSIDKRQCPECHNISRAKYAQKNANKRKEHYANNLEQMAIERSIYRAKNKERLIEYEKNRYASNPEKEKARVAAYNAANPETRKKCYAAYRAKNKDKIRISKALYRSKTSDIAKIYNKQWTKDNASSVNKRNLAWAKLHPENCNARNAKRKASKLQATPIWANKLKIEEFYYTAKMLGMHTGEHYQVDHIVPLQSKLVCGLHCEANLQVITRGDNASKCNRYWPDMPSIEMQDKRTGA